MYETRITYKYVKITIREIERLPPITVGLKTIHKN